MKEAFISVNFHRATREMIYLANEIIESLAMQGYSLTLRQLYYQLVARDVIKNIQKNYKKLGEQISNARLAGLVDWSSIEDRTRYLRGINHRANPEEMVKDAAGGYHIDKWLRQPRRVEVWVEKDALVGIVQKACSPLDVNYFSCRGYGSQTALYRTAQRLETYIEDGQAPIILHFGDHDPSGINMTDDIIKRLEMFTDHKGIFDQIEVRRIALNMDQVKKYNPPPNPAKEKDSRYKAYKRKFGVNCWELDALSPQVIDGLITENILSVRDERIWAEDVARETAERTLLTSCATRWTEVVKLLSKPAKVAKPKRPKKKKTAKKKTKKTRKTSK